MPTPYSSTLIVAKHISQTILYLVLSTLSPLIVGKVQYQEVHVSFLEVQHGISFQRSTCKSIERDPYMDLEG